MCCDAERSVLPRLLVGQRGPCIILRCIAICRAMSFFFCHVWPLVRTSATTYRYLPESIRPIPYRGTAYAALCTLPNRLLQQQPCMATQLRPGPEGPVHRHVDVEATRRANHGGVRYVGTPLEAVGGCTFQPREYVALPCMSTVTSPRRARSV